MENLPTIGFKADTSGLKNAERGLDSLAKKGEQSEKRINKSVDNTNQSFKSLRSSIGLAGAALAALGSARLTQELITQSDAWKNINSQIRQVTKSETQLLDVRKELLALSKDTRSDLVNTVDLYATLTRSTKDLGTSQAEVMNVTKTLNNLFVAGGKPISEVSGAIRQLSQGFASGALRGDEFNSVAEGAPKIMDALAVKLKMTRGELREFAATGGITAQIMIDALKDYSSTAQNLADQTTKTWGQSMENSSTNITAFIGKAENLNTAIDYIGGSIESLTGELDFFSKQVSLWTGQWSEWGDEATSVMDSTSETFSRQFMALGSFVDETMKFMGEAIMFFPANIRAMVKVLAVELAFAIDVVIQKGAAILEEIKRPFVLMPTVVEEYITAFGNVLGTRLAAIVEKTTIYGKEIKDSLNPFDGDTYDSDAALAQAEKLAQQMTNAYLQGADDRINAEVEARDKIVAEANIVADAKIEASQRARTSTLIDIMAERDATLSVYSQIEEAAVKLSDTTKPKVNKTPLVESDDEIEDRLKRMKKLTGEVDNFGGAWSRTGSVIVDTFGDMADSLNDYMKRMEDLDSVQEKINKSRKDDNADLIALDRLQASVNQERVDAELSGMASIAGAVGGLFDEKTAAAKAFAAVEKGIAVAQIAMSLEKMLSSNVETATVVANESTKQVALATTAVVNQGSGDPYTAFVRIAAMGAIMATLVSGFSGGGSGGGVSASSSEARQKAQGTGTVLGSDDKSESIANAFERFEDLEIENYAVLKDIRGGIFDLSNSIQNLASGLVSIFGNFGTDSYSGDLGTSEALKGKVAEFHKIGAFLGDPIGDLLDDIVGSFKTTKKSLTDSGISITAQTMKDIIDNGLANAQQYADIKTKKKSFWGLTSSTKYETEYQEVDDQLQRELGLIFTSIGSTINSAVDVLGLDVINNLDNFLIDIPNLSLMDLDGEGVTEQLQAVFSAQSDLMATYLVPNLKDFQKVGEGLYDTLIRVAQEQAIFNSSIERMGFDLSALSSVMQIEVAQSLANMVGGFEDFSELTSSFFDNFYSDSEQLTALGDSLTSVFDSLGLSLVTTREDFKALVSGIDITTEGGQELLAALLEINPALSDYIAELEKIEEQRTSMTIELLELQGNAEEALAMQREIELAAMDESLRALQLLIYAEEDRLALLVEQENAIINAMSALEDSIDLEKDRAQAILDVAREAYEAEIERISALKDALNAENVIRQANYDEAEAMLNASFSKEISLIQENAAARIAALTDERTALSSTATAMNTLVDKINGALGLSGTTDLIGALSSARSGDFSGAQNLDVNALTNLDSSGFSSAADLNVQTAINKNRLNEIGGLAGAELSDAERMIAAIDSQILTTQSVADEQVENLTEQLNTLLGIDTGILSVDASVREFKEAQMSLDALNFEAELEKYDMLIDSADDVYHLHEQAYDEQILALDDILAVNQALYYSSLNINQSILSMSDAIIVLQETITESNNYQRETAKNTKTSATAAKEAKLNGQEVRVIT